MGVVMMNPGGGGIGSDELTATAATVRSGYSYVGKDTNDEVGTGTLPTLTANDYAWQWGRTTVNKDVATTLSLKASKEGYTQNALVAKSTTTGRPTVTVTGGTGNENIGVTPQVVHAVTVNRTAAYNAGVNAQIAKGLTVKKHYRPVYNGQGLNLPNHYGTATFENAKVGDRIISYLYRADAHVRTIAGTNTVWESTSHIAYGSGNGLTSKLDIFRVTANGTATVTPYSSDGALSQYSISHISTA